MILFSVNIRIATW